MQLAQLINRLNPDELTELLMRHGIAPETTDPAKIGALVVQGPHLRAILTELNQAQLLIVRWTAQQQNLQASWDHFLAVLDNRIPEAALHHDLHELRMYGVLDYDATPVTGWIATYPAVAGASPISQGIDLASALNGMTAEMLYAMCQRLSITPVPGTKAKRIEVLTRCLSDHDFLASLLNLLPTNARELFEWFNARGGLADHNALAAKLKDGYYTAISYVSRALTGYGASSAAKGSSFIDLLERGLVAGVSAYGNNWGYASYFAVPNEVKTAYAGTTVFDTAPLVPPRLVSAAPTETRMPNMTALLRDLSHLRAFISLGRAEWRQDGEPYARSLQALSKLVNGPTKDYGAMLWQLALDVPVVAHSGDPDECYVAAEVGGLAPDDMIRSLILGWSEERTSAYGRDLHVPRDAHSRVLTLLPSLPADVWIERASFERFLSFRWPLLFGATVEPGTEPISGNWDALYATVLGRGVDKANHESFLVQSAGLELIFDRAPKPRPSLPDWDSSWIVQADRTIVVPPNAHPDSILDLWSVADLVENQGASIFRVSSDSITAALNRGMTPDEISMIFARHSRTPLPTTIERIIRDQSQRYGQVRVGGAASYLQVDDPDVLDEIVRNAKLNRLAIRVIAPTVAVVRGADEAATLATLRRAGYLPTAAPTTQSSALPTPLFLRQTQGEIKSVLRSAIDGLRLVRIRWSDPRTGVEEQVAEPDRLRRSTLLAYQAESGQPLEIELTRITSVVPLSAKQSGKYFR